eukprot:symbB.v1.2.010881.t2/scaffold689.1/size246588/12
MELKVKYLPAGGYLAELLHDFALTCLELLLEQGEDARETAESWLTDSSALYLGVPVIPRMQSRMRTCLHALRRGNWFQSKLLDELLNLETDGSDFDATGSNLGAFRTEDPIHCRFQRLIREAVVGRVDRSCHMDCRQHGLKAQCCSPINSSAWTKSRRCELLLEVLDSVPQEPRQRVLQLLDEETPEERAMQSDIQRFFPRHLRQANLDSQYRVHELCFLLWGLPREADRLRMKWHCETGGPNWQDKCWETWITLQFHMGSPVFEKATRQATSDQKEAITNKFKELLAQGLPPNEALLEALRQVKEGPAAGEYEAEEFDVPCPGGHTPVMALANWV